MHTRQGVASPALSQNSARPNSSSAAITTIHRLRDEALSIAASARIAGRFSPAQSRRLLEIESESAQARRVLNVPEPSREPLPLLLDPEHDMYPLEVNLNGSTRHSRFCKATPRRRDWSCHRCCELMQGSAPRRGGWQREFFARKLRQRSFVW